MQDVLTCRKICTKKNPAGSCEVNATQMANTEFWEYVNFLFSNKVQIFHAKV